MSKVVCIGSIGHPVEKNAAAPFGTTAKTDQNTSRTPQRAVASIPLGRNSNEPEFSDNAKVVASLRAGFALCGWQLEPDPRIDGSTAYLVSRWGCRMRALTNIDDVRALLAQIGGAQ